MSERLSHRLRRGAPDDGARAQVRETVLGSDAVLTPSAWLCRKAVETLALPPQVQIEVLPNFVDPETFHPLENGGGEVVQDYSFSLADEDFSTQVNEIASLDPQPEVLFTAMVMPQTPCTSPRSIASTTSCAPGYPLISLIFAP